jgi:nicotinate dehydrogenase subunit B
MMTSPGRRRFLCEAGYISIGFVLLPPVIAACLSGENNEAEGSFAVLPDDGQVDAWLQILDDGSVQVLTGRMELGQGVKVIMQQVAGEELNLEPEKIRVVVADTGLTPNEGYTAGSRSVESGAMSVRQAAATAREILVEKAAALWKTDAAGIGVEDGYLLHPDGVNRLAFVEVLQGTQLSSAVRKDARLKPKDEYRWIGKAYPHPDMPKIVRGEAIFVHDLRMEGMLHARVLRPPVYGANLTSWDRDVGKMPGVVRVVSDGSFLAVIAREEYQAVKAMQALNERSEWQGGQDLPEVRSWDRYLLEAKSLLPPSGSTLQAVYSKPYIMHASIGPSCAVAQYDGQRLHIWSHTQGVYPLRSTITHLTGMAETSIRITGVKGSGCYGHNGADDVAADAALLALAHPNHPIRVQTERTEEHRWEPYGSAMRMELAASLDQGKITDWQYQLWSDSHSTRPRGDAGNLLAARYLQKPFPFKRPGGVGGGTRNAEPYYHIPQSKVTDHFVGGPLRTSALRSLGAYANIFAIESFMDELAEIAGADPLDFRIRHLNDPRAVAVISRLRAITMGETNQTNEGVGFAFSRYKNTAAYCAVAAKIYLDPERRSIRPVKMWAVLEAGEAINTDGLKNQIAGGMIQSASWTIREEVRFNRKEITSRDWTTYPVLRYPEIPDTEVVILNQPELPPLGAGEAAQGPAAAAIANALYQASGKRIRNLPLEKHFFGG